MFFMLAVACLLFSAPGYALTCGDIVSGTVTLTGDLNCAGNGLIVGANNTVINLNGHSITCSGAGGGYLGSCQDSTANLPTVPPSLVGINSFGHNNVAVFGPGTINGFNVGIRLDGAHGFKVTGVTISGPTEPFSTDIHSRRVITVGILIANTTCTISALAPAPSALVQFNDVSNQTMGVQLSSAQCTQVTGNFLHDNQSFNGDAHGVDVINSPYNTINANIITRNGVNTGIDGGITLVDSAASNNQILQNFVFQNCGNGITVFNGGHNNVIASNVALDNSTNTLNGRCATVPVGKFYDLAAVNEGAGNVWNPNNTCKTSSPGVPAGVCP
jgi:hypothetical protein